MHTNTCNCTDKKKKKESDCEMGSSCGLAVESPPEEARFILSHRKEERNPRGETSVRPVQSKQNNRKQGFMQKVFYKILYESVFSSF